VGVIQELAADLDAQERTLRRAAAQGALRATRSGPRRLRLAAGEREYLRAHWWLLSSLRRALRTEHSVRLAVLYGSLARGDEDGDSDLDLLVSLADDRPSAGFRLGVRLQRISGRRVDIAQLERIEARAPLLLERILDEGRVLIDRDGQWDRLCEHRSEIHARSACVPPRDGWRRSRDRGADGVSDPSPVKLSSRALAAEQARLARFFQTINKHRKALDLAIEEGFGGKLDPADWRRAFESAEPHDANRTMVVTGDHSAALNAYVEILKASAGSRLISSLPHRRPSARTRAKYARSWSGSNTPP